jgi:DNA-binding NarL/FixJ family response regulator
VAAARAETAWLRGDADASRTIALAAWPSAQRQVQRAWITSELAYWLHQTDALDALPEFCVAAYALQIAGRWREAADVWAQLGCVYEQARALAAGDASAQLEALAQFERLGAQPDAERLRARLHADGVRGVPRGQRASTQAHPHALTAREAQVLELLCAGLKNAEIARRLSRSVRTVDHHVAAVIAKLGVGSRAEAIATALRTGLATPK